MTPRTNEWIVRADARDPMRDAHDEAKRCLERVESSLGVVEGGRPGFRAKLRALWFSLAPGGKKKALTTMAAGLRSVLEATERAAEWQNAQATYQSLLAERQARGAPRAPWRGADESPVLLLGTGGGGTRVLAEAAARLGLFLGPTINESFDSVGWVPLVYELVTALGEVGAPPPDVLPQGSHARERILETARALNEPWNAQGEAFGFKLPELLLVLPLFLDAFPKARVVFLVRHPLSAAFRRPHVTTTPGHPLGRVVLQAAYRAQDKPISRISTDPLWLRQTMAWIHQVGRADRWLAENVPSDRVLRLRLEEFALNPRGTLERLAAHMGRPAPKPGEASVFDEERVGEIRTGLDANLVKVSCLDAAESVGYGRGWLDAPWEVPERRDLFRHLA